MVRKVSVATLAVALGISLAQAQPPAQEQEPSIPMRPESQRPPDWSNYKTVGDVVGEVVKADDKSVTFRVSWNVAVRSSGGRRPRLSRNHRNFYNPFSSRSRGRVKVKHEHHDYQLEFVPESLVRIKKLPPKFDSEGNKSYYTQREMDQMKQPPSVPGYLASPADLTPGTYIEVIVIRDKSIPANKVQENDLRVKYAMILGKDPNPPADLTSSAKKPAAKKKKK